MATKRIKSEFEKNYITRMWSLRKRYNDAKRDYDSVWGSWMDGELMKRTKREMERVEREHKRECLRRAA